MSVSREDVYMEPPTSMWTGAVYRDAAATQGIPDILWFKLTMFEYTELVGEVLDGDELELLLRYAWFESKPEPTTVESTLILYDYTRSFLSIRM